MKSERDDAEESHSIVLPDAPIVMSVGELPIVREGTVGGIPAYEADPPKAQAAQKTVSAKKKKGRTR